MLPGLNRFELSDEVIRIAVENHLKATLLPGTRVASVQLDYNKGGVWVAALTTDAKQEGEAKQESV